MSDELNCIVVKGLPDGTREVWSKKLMTHVEAYEIVKRNNDHLPNDLKLEVGTVLTIPTWEPN